MSKKGLGFKDWSLENKPREKMLRYGVERLSTIELLAILLGTGARGLNVMACASEVLKQSGGLIGLREKSLRELMKIKGLNLAKAARIIASLELGKKLFQEQKSTKQTINSVKDLVDFYIAKNSGLKQSRLDLVLLDGRSRVIAEEEIFKGTLTEVTIHPREIFGRAVEERAAAIILISNHPSGEVRPTQKDFKSFERLAEAGEILGIAVFDYVIIGKNSYFSFKERGGV